MKTIVRAASIIALLVTLATVVVSTASAATGSTYRGRIRCAKLSDGFLNQRIYSDSPAVRAANTTTGVDYQWVAWRTQVVEGDGAPVTGWSPYAMVRASDQSYTSAFTLNNASIGTGFFWDFSASYAIVKYKTTNEVFFYGSSGWQLGARFFSAPSASSGTDMYGDGYC